MRRADRLFLLLQELRRRRRTRARDLAEALEVSLRTVYRDVADLMAAGVPIDGEAGVGYRLRDGYDLPPLMFDRNEIEALVLGARIVSVQADPELAAAAENLLAKVEAVLPESLRDKVFATPLWAPPATDAPLPGMALPLLRRAITERQKLRFAYVDAAQAATRRTVRPLGLLYYGRIWLLAAWCELRGDFRNFRVDRIAEATVLDERFRDEPGKRLMDLFKQEGVEISALVR